MINIDYSVITINKNIIFKKATTNPCNKLVYVLTDGSNKNNYQTIKGDIKYIGKGSWCRPFTHKNDLYTQYITANPKAKLYIISGLSDIESSILEAFLIRFENATKELHKTGSQVIIKDCLLNKKRERNYEKDIITYLNVSEWLLH